MIGTTGEKSLDCGINIYNFNERKLLDNFKKLNFYDFQGSTWAPHLIHKDLWNKVMVLVKKFYPGTGSDPDLNMKLWRENVRIFKGLGKCLVFHFGSVVTEEIIKILKSKQSQGIKGIKFSF